jgi:hypothetical protein
MKEEIEKRKKSTNRLIEAAQGKPLALTEEAYGSLRENGGTMGSNNPNRLNKGKVAKEDMNNNDKFYLGVKKGAEARRKTKEALKEASAKKKTAKPNGATEKLKAARKAMNLDR